MARSHPPSGAPIRPPSHTGSRLASPTPAALAALALTTVALTISVATPRAVAGQNTSLALDTASLADGPHARMHALLERTIFQVDVLTLDIRVGPRTAGALERLASGHDYSDGRADSVAAAMLEADDVFTRIRFRRGVELEQLLDGIRKNLRTARRAGIVGEEAVSEVADSLSIWYRPLAERGIREGDTMMYRIRGDSLRVVFRGVDGRILLDQLRVGRTHTLSVLGGYFAPGAELRGGLIRSLFGREE